MRFGSADLDGVKIAAPDCSKGTVGCVCRAVKSGRDFFLGGHDDLANPDRRVRLAMPLEAAIVLAPLEMLDENPGRRKRNHFADDARAGDNRLADLGVGVLLA